MRDLGGRLTDSGQVVTDQIVPFSKIRGGWIQDANCRWQRLMVPSGEEQVVRTGSVKSRPVEEQELQETQSLGAVLSTIGLPEEVVDEPVATEGIQQGQTLDQGLS